MSDLPQQNTIVQYVADGITSIYNVTFYTPIDSDGTPNLDVFTQAADAQPVPENDIKLWGVDYTYTPNLDPISGGVVTFLPGKIPPNGYIITIVRDVQASLDVEFSQAQTFSGFTLDAALDKLLLISQQNKSYALGRNLSYIVNSYIPESTISANVQIPVLQTGQVWYGSAGGVIAATLEEPADVSTLRSELANNAPITNGASLVGYYDEVNLNPTNVSDQLNYLTAAVVAPFPTGSMIDFGGTSAPAGFLLCDGSAISRTTFSELFSVIGTAWGDGNGTTTFNVPDARGYVTAGAGGTLPPIANTVGSKGGSATYTLISANLPPHAHGFTYTFPGVALSGAVSGYGINANTPVNVGASTDNGPGVSTAFTIVQPTAIVLKIIKT